MAEIKIEGPDGRTETIYGEYNEETRTATSSGGRKIQASANDRITVSGCFPKGTMVLTKTGLVDISKIKTNTYVTSIDKKGNLKHNKIIKIKKYNLSKIWEVKLMNGTIIRTTSKHSFLVNNHKWKKAFEITPNDKLSILNNQGVIENFDVMSSFDSKEVESVYNLIIEKNYNFIANGTIAHSFSYFRVVRMFFWEIYRKILNSNSIIPKVYLDISKNRLSPNFIPSTI